MISPLIYELLSGRAFFLGIALLLISVVGRWWAHLRFLGVKGLAVMSLAMTCLGVGLILVSSTPVPLWLYIATWTACGAWLLVEYVPPISRWADRRNMLKGPLKGRLHTLARGLVILLLLVQIAMELPYQVTPRLAGLNCRAIIVIGDSVSSGISGADRPWPLLLGQSLKVPVVNLAEAGATLDRAAKKQVPRLGNRSGLLILEIGGNDLLYRRPYDRFEASMEALLRAVVRNDREIIMFELPTLPFESRYGAIQRRLAAQYGVALIPKRRFIDVMNHPGATVDGIHLSKMGHGRMATMMAKLLTPMIEQER